RPGRAALRRPRAGHPAGVADRGDLLRVRAGPRRIDRRCRAAPADVRARRPAGVLHRPGGGVQRGHQLGRLRRAGGRAVCDREGGDPGCLGIGRRAAPRARGGDAAARDRLSRGLRALAWPHLPLPRPPLPVALARPGPGADGAGRRQLVADGYPHLGAAGRSGRLAAGGGDAAALGGGGGARAHAGRARRDRSGVRGGAGSRRPGAGDGARAARGTARLPGGVLPAAAAAGGDLLPGVRGARYRPESWKRSASSIAGKCLRWAARRSPLIVVVVTTSMSPHSLTASPAKSMIALSPEYPWPLPSVPTRLSPAT